MPDRKLKFETAKYTENIRIPANCNGITFINNSTVVTDIVYINDIPLQPNGGAISFQCNANEIDTTEYFIQVNTSLTAIINVIKAVYI